MIKLPLFIVFLAFFCGCQKSSLYMAKDFTESGSFTQEAEGPAVDKKGHLYAVSYEYKETIGKLTPEGKGEVFIKMPKGSTANGIRFSKKEEMFIADYTGHNILKADSTGKVSIYAHNKNMNQPNDIAMMGKGVLFASDPNWSQGTGQLWRINLGGSTTLMEKEMGTTNGIEVSPDETKLYVNESKQLNLWVYEIDKKLNLQNKKLLYKFKDGGLDGMRCDKKGNLYVTRYGKGEIVMISPEGKLLRTIKLKGLKPTNIAFGGPDGKTCYVTVADRGNIEFFRTDTAGRSWEMRK